jgi:hypothetical protein
MMQSSRQTLTRRAALGRLSAGALLTAGLWPGALRAAEEGAGSSFRFLVVNDLHYITPDCGAWLAKVVAQMRTHEGVEFCLVAGDLCENGTEEQLTGARDALKQLGLPFHVVVGNHDYTPAPRKVNASPAPTSPATPEKQAATPGAPPAPDRRAYDAVFPDQVNYHFEHRGWQFLGLDTSEGLLYENTRIQPATFEWLDTHLPKLDPRKPTVIFTHFPLGPNVKYRPANADALLERFKPFNLQAVFCGHWHGFSERTLGAATLTTNRCCALKRGNHDGSKEKGYFLCAARAGRLTREFVLVKSA